MPDEVVRDPQVLAASGIVDVPDGVATTALPASPCDLHGTPCEPRWMAPKLGQHSDEILGELGYSADAIARLRERRAVG